MTRHRTFFASLLWIGIVLMPIRFRVRISILIPYGIWICILPQVYKCWQTRKFIFYFYSKSSFIYLSRQPHRCHIFSIWDSSLTVFYNDPNPDPDPVRICNTSFAHVQSLAPTVKYMFLVLKS
jgi:hypothetical protein